MDWSRATKEIINYAIGHEVDFVVHSGDLFNSNKVDHTSLIHAIKLLGSLKDANIPLFVIDGNHDRRKGAQKNGPNDVLQQLELCRYLSPEGGSLDNAIATIGGVHVIGLGYQGIYLKKRLEDFYQQIPDGSNVILLHAGVKVLFGRGTTRYYSCSAKFAFALRRPILLLDTAITNLRLMTGSITPVVRNTTDSPITIPKDIFTM